MPIQVVEKPKTEHKSVTAHKDLVPLKLQKMEYGWKGNDEKKKADIDSQAEIGDICFVIGGYHGCHQVFNCRTQRLMDRQLLEHYLFVRAYEVKQIVLMNDDEPAPII